MNSELTTTSREQATPARANTSEKPGCLGVILRLFGIMPREASVLPYRMRDDFLSPAEISFYRALCAAIGDGAMVCPKVNLADIFFVVRPNENRAYRNKIDRKHVDFLLCNPTSMRPIAGVELDDASHQRADRQDRDGFIDSVFKAAGLPIIHVPVRRDYNVNELAALLMPYVGKVPATEAPATQPPPSQVATSDTPMCRKCGIAMVLRSRRSGQGEQFWGCPNYPKCRETMPV